MSTPRLSPEKWLNAGLAALRSDGAATLGAEPLARVLKTTKGSFYWHFKDVPSFHAALLDHWRSQALASLGQAVEASDAADGALRQFGRCLLDDPAEPHLRSWAQGNPDVAAILAEVDTARVAYLQELLRDLGLGNADFAYALQATLIGLPQLAPGDTDKQRATFDTLVDTVLALS